MSAPEVLHRLIETAKKQAARRHSRGWDAIEPLGRMSEIARFRSRIARCPPNLAAVITQEAEKALVGSFELLGARWPKSKSMPPDPLFWRTDPRDGEPFPQWEDYAFDISFRHGVNTRELKCVWELNRLQFLVPLAADAMLTGRDDSAAVLTSTVNSWMEGNPPFRGPSWISGIELALRVISVAVALSCVGIDGTADTMRPSLIRFFFAHIEWIRRFPSLHSSANNHRIGELAGLIVGLTMAPGFPGAAALRENSWEALLAAIRHQIHPDGVGAEQAPGYTAFSIELFLVAATAIGREKSLPEAVVDRLSAWCEHSLWLMDDEGKVPSIGDFDDCRAIATTQEAEPRYVASIVSAVAGCIDRPDLGPPSKAAGIRDLILASAAASQTRPVGLRSFRAGGYSVIRSSDKDPVVLTFDHGPVGFLSIAAHGHADTLSIWLSVGRRQAIVDAGTYLYQSDRKMRDRMRNNAVHNTLRLEDIGSSVTSGPFNWARKANARLISSRGAPTARVVAEHDGYLAEFGVKHRRTVEFDGGSLFTIVDELLGARTDTRVTVSFLLDPTCRSVADQRAVLIAQGDRPVLRIASAGPLRPRVVRGDETIGLGWVSPSFGMRIPADQVLFEGHLDEPSTITICVL